MLIQKSHRWRYLSLVMIALFGISGVTASALGTERPELTANEEVASTEKQDITIENVDDLIITVSARNTELEIRETETASESAPAVEAETESAAQESEAPRVSFGAGIQTSFLHHDTKAMFDGDGNATSDDPAATDHFRLNSLRFYVNGSVTDNIKFMVNTDINYGGSMGSPGDQGNDIQVLDAVAQIEMSDKFNVWVGRFLPPSDRANLYGPFFSNHWGVFTDGVQDGYPFVFQGRDNGAVYWGQFDKVKISAGAFDGMSATGDTALIGAGRIQVDFWDPEPGYYLNGTYYGEKDILAVGVAGQVQGSEKQAYSVDFLLERKVGDGGAASFEAQWAKYDQLGGYNAHYGRNDGGYALGAYLFPTTSGVGRFQLLGKYAHARYRRGMFNDPDYDQKTTEVNLNYIINNFNARMMIFYKNTRYTAVYPDDNQVGVALQLQM